MCQLLFRLRMVLFQFTFLVRKEATNVMGENFRCVGEAGVGRAEQGPSSLRVPCRRPDPWEGRGVSQRMGSFNC